MTNLATPMFLSGPDDKLAAVDIYKRLAGDVTGLNLDTINLLETALAKSFKADWGNLQNLKILIGNSIDGLLVDINALKSGILSAANGLIGFFNQLPPWLQKSLLNVSGFNKISVTLNGLTKYINSADLSTVNGLAQLIKGISGCEFPLEVQDERGRLLLSINLVKETYKLGMPGGYDAFINCIKDKYFGIELTKAVTPFIVETSNVELLNDVSKGPYAEWVENTNPSFIKSFTSNFKLNSNDTEDTYDNTLTNIYSSFGRINKKWSPSEELDDIQQYSNCSNDFNKLLEVRKNKTLVDIDDSLNIDPASINSSIILLSNKSAFFKTTESILDSEFNFLV